MTLSLLVPIRGHQARRELFWETLCATTAGAPLELVLRVDDDDPEALGWATTRDPLPMVVIGPRYDGYRSLPRFFNEMAAAATGDVLMCGNDDMRFLTPGWVERLLGAAAQYPDGIFNLGTYTFPAGAFPWSCVSRQLVDTLGFLNDERLVFSDIFLRDVAARFDRLVLLPDVVIMHVGDAAEDALTVKAGVHADAVDYWRLHEQCVAEAVAHLRAA